MKQLRCITYVPALSQSLNMLRIQRRCAELGRPSTWGSGYGNRRGTVVRGRQWSQAAERRRSQARAHRPRRLRFGAPYPKTRDQRRRMLNLSW